MNPFRLIFARSPDESYFKFRKIFIYATLALCLPVLANAWLDKSYLPLLLVPPSLLFTWLFTQKKYFFIAVEWKIYTDMLVFVILFLSGGMDRLTMSGSVYTSFFIYILINLFILRSRFLFLVALLYVSLPFIGSYFFKVGNFFIFGCLSLLAVFIAFIIRLAKEQDDHAKAIKQKELEAKYEEISDFYKITKLNENLLIHDCKNILQSTLQIELEHRVGACSEKTLQTALSIKSRILEKLDMITDLSKADIAMARTIREILSQMLADTRLYRVEIPEEVNIHFNPKLFDSLIFNLLKNAIEAYRGRHEHLKGFMFQVKLIGNNLILEDNAGGFDPTLIAKGYSTKPSGSGEFLHMLTKNEKELGLRVQVTRLENGMRFQISFDPAHFLKVGGTQVTTAGKS